MTFVSFAQNFEDVMLWRALKEVDRGTYIDIGAQDPVVDSVSCAFYETGWRGFHVEPNSEFAEKLRLHRPDETIIQALVADTVGLRTFYEIAGSGLSTARADVAEFHKKHHGHSAIEKVIPATTLDEIFTIAGEGAIHWLKVDVEGLEAEVLRGWQTSAARPWIVIVEATYPTTGRPLHMEWEHLIFGKGYDLVYQDGLNRFYLHEDRSDLASRFTLPPNVFDNFQLSGRSTSITAQMAWRHEQLLQVLRTERDELSNALEQHRSDVTSLQQQIVQISSERKAVVEEALENTRRMLSDSHARILEEERRAHSVKMQALQGQLQDDLKRHRQAYDVELQAVQKQLNEAIEQAVSLQDSFGRATNELRKSTIELLRLHGPPDGFRSLFSRGWKRRHHDLLEHARLLLGRQGAVDGCQKESFFNVGPVHCPPSQMVGMRNVKTIVHIGGLIVLEREEFIRTLYYNFLGRAPDESGMQFYLYCLYQGIRKEKIIYDIFKSSECRKRADDFAGLDKILQRESKRRKFPGKFLAKISDLFRSNVRNEVVILDSRMPNWQPPVQERGAPEVSDSVLSDISAAIEGLDQAHKDLFHKIEYISAAIEGIETRQGPDREGRA